MGKYCEILKIMTTYFLNIQTRENSKFQSNKQKKKLTNKKINKKKINKFFFKKRNQTKKHKN